MKLTKIWVVTDPSPVSELVDILYETTTTGLARLAIGTGAAAWERENTTLYTEEAEAKRDALARLKKRGPAKGNYTYDRNGDKIPVTIPGRE